MSMFDLGDHSGETYAIFGLARSGMAAAQSLRAAGAAVVLDDDSAARRDQAAEAGFELRDLVQDFPGQAGILVLSPGVPLTYPAPHPVVLAARAAGAEIIGDTEVFARALDALRHEGRAAKLVAVTGTNGKSTTTALIGHILKSAGRPTEIGGNIGRSVLDLKSLKAEGVYVIEMSSYQIDLSPGFSADVACLMNVTPDHLDRHGGFENYAAVKAKLLDQVRAEGALVVAVDDPVTAAIADRFEAAGRRVLRASHSALLERGVFAREGRLIDALTGEPQAVLELSALDRLPGQHNVQNIAVAYAATRALGLDVERIIDGIADFPGLAHRLELVARRGTVRFVNDSKATNADAAAKALSSYDGIHWIAGGIAKAGGIESLRPYFPRIRRAYLIGAAADEFAATLGSVPHEISGDLESAVRAAAINAGGNDVVLLSPAASSFDQFADFEERGECFTSLARELAR
jgi:UDP-N-acetylmuramoylalanine--D-glutamate ligase